MSYYTPNTQICQEKGQGSHKRGAESNDSQPQNQGQAGPFSFSPSNLALEKEKSFKNPDKNSLDELLLTNSGFLGGSKEVTIDFTDISGHRWVGLYCRKCGHKFKFKTYCGDRLCPVCLPRRYQKLYRSYLRKFTGKSNLRHVVLTVRNLDHFNKKEVQWIRKCFDKLRSREIWRPVAGGMYVVQVTQRQGKGWHLHLHCIIESKVYLCRREISKQWREITTKYVYKVEGKKKIKTNEVERKGSYVVHIEQVKSQKIL